MLYQYNTLYFAIRIFHINKNYLAKTNGNILYYFDAIVKKIKPNELSP